MFSMLLERVIQAIPREPGSYLLWLNLPLSRGLTVGKLGSFTFPAGDYVYMGSARGPGGLRARLGRHLRGSGQPHWHIDHLRTAAQVRGFGYQTNTAHASAPYFGGIPHSSGDKECDWSQRLVAQPEASLPAPGFGASDCRSGCAAHLVHFAGGRQQTPGTIADLTGVHLRIVESMVYLPKISGFCG